MTVRISDGREELLERFALPDLDQPTVLRANQVIDVLRGTLLSAPSKALLVGDDLDRALDSLERVERSVAGTRITAVDCLLDVGIDVRPLLIPGEYPEGLGYVLGDEWVVGTLYDAGVILQRDRGLTKAGVDLVDCCSDDRLRLRDVDTECGYECSHLSRGRASGNNASLGLPNDQLNEAYARLEEGVLIAVRVIPKIPRHAEVSLADLSRGTTTLQGEAAELTS